VIIDVFERAVCQLVKVALGTGITFLFFLEHLNVWRFVLAFGLLAILLLVIRWQFRRINVDILYRIEGTPDGIEYQRGRKLLKLTTRDSVSLERANWSDFPFMGSGWVLASPTDRLVIDGPLSDKDLILRHIRRTWNLAEN
jgi:hypothetical protein